MAVKKQSAHAKFDLIMPFGDYEYHKTLSPGQGFIFTFNENIPMSLPQKKRGFRKIVIDGKEFNWRSNALIEVCPVSSKANKLIVDIGWVDPFLHMNEKSASPLDNDPRIVSPSFIRKAIEFALIHNWDITEKTRLTKVIYRDNQFNIE